MKTSLVFFAAFALTVIARPADAHKGLTFQGYLKDANGQLVTASNVTMTSRLVSPNGCVLMEETHSGVAINSGFFTVVIGSGTRTGADKSLALKDVFSNTTARAAFDTLNGAAGSCNYTPTANDARQVALAFTVGADSIEANFNIRANAYAVWSEVAEDASKLGGKPAAEFIQTSANVTQSGLESFMTSVAGNSISGSSIASLPWSKLTSIPSPLATIGGLSCANGQVLKMTGAAWACATDATGGGGGGGSGTVTDVTSSNAYITIATSTSTPALTLNVGTTANTVAAGDDSRFGNASEITSLVSTGIVQRNGAASYSTVTVNPPLAYAAGTLGVTTGTTSGTLAAGDDARFGNATKIQSAAVDVTGLATNNSLKYDGTKWIPYAPATGTLTGVSSANAYLSVTGTTAPSLTLNVGTAANTVAAGNDSRFGDASKLNGTIVDSTGLASGKVLQYDGTQWTPTTLSSGATSLSGLSDVKISSGNANILFYPGSTPPTPSSSGIIAIGKNTVQNITSAHDTIAIGDAAGRNITTGYDNVLIGTTVGFTTGYRNVAIGSAAGQNATTGANNVMIGRMAGRNATGDTNILIGNAAGMGATFTAGSNNILIGADIDVPASGTNNYLSIANMIYGNISTGTVGIGAASPRATLDVNGSVVGKAATSASATVDFASGNLQYTSLSCGAFILQNMKDGGSYTLAVQGATSGTCSFTAYSDASVTLLTTHLPPDHVSSIANTHTLYNFLVLGTHVYVSWVPGY